MQARSAILLLIALIAPLCHAAPINASGTITVLRQATILQPANTVQDVMIFQLSPAFSSGCIWVWIPATDKQSAAVAAAAKLAGVSVSIWYDPAVPAPWGETDMCGMMSIDLL